MKAKANKKRISRKTSPKDKYRYNKTDNVQHVWEGGHR